MKILIKVKREHIDKGKCQESTRCAIALAIRELLPDAVVGTTVIVFDGGGPDIQLPFSAQHFIEIFDSGVPKVQIPEISFQIIIPNEIIDRIGIGEAYRILSESKTLELVEI